MFASLICTRMYFFMASRARTVFSQASIEYRLCILHAQASSNRMTGEFETSSGMFSGRYGAWSLVKPVCKVLAFCIVFHGTETARVERRRSGTAGGSEGVRVRRRHWCKLTSMSAQGVPSPCMPVLAATFAALLEHAEPGLEAQLAAACAFSTRDCAVAWMACGFVGVLDVEEVCSSFCTVR